MTPEILRQKKADAEKITGLTAYDTPTAMLADRAGVDVILVGDTLGPMLLGHRKIEETTLDEMVHHGRAAARGAKNALVVVDLPFGTYEFSSEDAARNAIHVLKATGAGAVKLEGGLEIAPTIERLARGGASVFAHLTPAHAPHPSGKGIDTLRLVEAARALEEAGAVAVVLVGLSEAAAGEATRALARIPSIGFRSGPHCDGQLYVTPLMLGLVPAATPQAGPYGNLAADLEETFRRFKDDVKSGRFPPA